MKLDETLLVQFFKFIFNLGYKTGLYYITARKLHLLMPDSGVVDFITLPKDYRFSELVVDDETHTLAVSSVKNPKGNTLVVFALYEYYPCLKFQQLLQVFKKNFRFIN